MRGKEAAEDYRYFPEPDLPPFVITADDIDRVCSDIPELPPERVHRYRRAYGLSEYDATVLCEERSLADFYETAAGYVTDKKLAANWVMVELLGAFSETGRESDPFPVTASAFGELLALIENGTFSGKIAKTVFEEMIQSGRSAQQVVDDKGLSQITDRGEIQRIVERILKEGTEQVKAYRSGKKKLLGYFVGQVMKATNGRANPQLVNEILEELLDEQ
jgi:aspartyl-tRNA(Asn)/glutamyl-tRNA(Gln) amidotransferase subunit B